MPSDQLAHRDTPPRALSSVVPVLGMVALMWVLEIVDAVPGVDLDQYGIRPRDAQGMFGIVAAPFLHGDFSHLIANTGVFLVLGALIAWTTHRFLAVTLGVALIGGFGTWLFGGELTIHIGASGLVYGYTAFLLTWGALTRRLLSIAVALLVAVMYGSLLWGVLPGQQGVSWEGHLFGALGGVLMGWWLSRRDSSPQSA